MLTSFHCSRMGGAALLLVTLAAQAQTPPPYVRVHGEATVSVQPDRAELDIGIISQAPSAKAASDLNGKQSSAVVEQLRALLPEGGMKSVNFSVNPNYRFAKEGGTPEILGYTANNTVRLRVDDLSMVQRVIDVATKAGANNINRLNFMLKDELRARAEALSQAATQARGGAEALAQSLQVKLGRVLVIEEGQPVIVSTARQAELPGAKAAAPGASIETGSIEIHASVSLTFEVAR